MKLLIIPPAFFVLAELWLVWRSRARRAPEIEATIEAHERFRAAIAASEKRPETVQRSTIDA